MKLGQVTGFTLVELVVVIVLIGIVASVFISRFSDSDAFNAAIFRDQVFSIVRSAQQSALGRADVVVSIAPNPTSEEVTIRLSQGSGPQ